MKCTLNKYYSLNPEVSMCLVTYHTMNPLLENKKVSLFFIWINSVYDRHFN